MIGDIDGDRLAFFEAEQGAGNLLVVSECADRVFGRDFERCGGYVEGVIGCGEALRVPGQCRGDCGHAAELEEAATGEHIMTLAGGRCARNERGKLLAGQWKSCVSGRNQVRPVAKEAVIFARTADMRN